MKARKYFEQHRLSVIVGVVIALMLVVGLAIIIPLGLRSGPPATTQTPTPTTGVATPTASPVTTPTPRASPGENTPTPEPGVILGSQACPAGIGNPKHWDAIIGTDNVESFVQSVSCANIMGDPSLQAMVLVRHTNAGATLDVYVFKNISSAKPTRIFLLQNLAQGDARISGYNTVMTAEVDPNSSMNASKPTAAWTKDLFREFQWDGKAGSFVQVAFPGMYPDLTRWQAEVAQNKTLLQQDTWKLDAVKTAQHFVAQFLPSAPTIPPIQLRLVSGGGARDLTAQVNAAFPIDGTKLGPVTKITLKRLEGNVNGVWEVTAIQADWMYFSSPKSGPATHISNPVTVTGYGSQFESQVGTVYILDHLYSSIGHAYAMGSAGFGSGPFTVAVPYVSSYQGGVQEGIVELVHTGGASFDSGVVMVKVLVNP